MRRRLHLALTVSALAVALLSACGTSSGRLPAGRASAMQAELDQVAAGVRSGNCTGAEQALSRVQGELLNLPRSTDAELRQRLQEGVDNLRARVPAACQQARGQSTTETQTQTETDTQSTDEKKTDKTDTGTTEQTTPSTTDTGQTQPPTDTGQTQPPDTGSSPGQNGTGGASAGGQGGGD